MILGIGSDLTPVDRIGHTLARHGDRFVRRVFSVAEIAHVDATAKGDAGIRAQGYAKRWAAKEAAAKALGLGIRDGIFLKDLAVMNDAAGRPSLVLSGGAEARLQAITPAGMQGVAHVSLSDDGGMALAFVVISAVETGNKR